MARITWERFLGELSDRLTNAGGATPDEGALAPLGERGSEPPALSCVADGDGVFSSSTELERFYRPVDAIALHGQAAAGPARSTGGTTLAALENDVANARLISQLARPVSPFSLPVAAAPTTGPALDLKQVAKDLARFEGSKTFMYRDSRGYVTTGVGHLLKSAADAQKLPWVHSVTGKPATRAEIEAAFTAVAEMPTGRKADGYRRAGGLTLPAGEAEALAQQRLEKEFLPGLRRLYPGFDAFPASAQHALIDMAYNCGVGGLAKFRNLAVAVAAQDWAAAAATCNRRTSREERNEWTRDMFLNAAAEAAASAPAKSGLQ